MEPIEVFQILGIEQTKDERALKNAYRDKLTVTNPEDDPEGFKRLRMAYEEACRYAGTPDAEENEEAEPTLEDDTPAGQWIRGVRKVYENITDRCDVEKWKALFEADDFLSLEEEENCTTYLLRFLMEHYKLPTAIWKLLDEKIHIVQNAGAFRERFPAQFVSYMVHKCESGEEVDFSGAARWYMAAAMGLGALCWRWCVSHAVHRALRGTVFVLVWPLRFAADYAVHPFKQWLLARIRKIRHARRHNAQDSCKKSGKKPKNVLQNKRTILYN